MDIVKKKNFANGSVYLVRTSDGFLIETTDTFLPFYTKDAVGRRQNALYTSELASRHERWMIGVSVMSGCPVGCKFCATGMMKRCRNLTAEEIVAQVDLVLRANPQLNPSESQEFKINYTRMGEPFLNVKALRGAIEMIDKRFPNAHHYVSTMGISGADYSWVRGNITLQISLHSLDESRRNDLIPFARKTKIAELGQIRVRSKLKTTLNLTLVDECDFDIEALRSQFPPEHFFVKLSPINKNLVSERNMLGQGVIEQQNLV